MVNRRLLVSSLLAGLATLVGVKKTAAQVPQRLRPLSICLLKKKGVVVYHGVIPNMPTHGWWSQIGGSTGTYIAPLVDFQEATRKETEEWFIRRF